MMTSLTFSFSSGRDDHLTAAQNIVAQSLEQAEVKHVTVEGSFSSWISTVLLIYAESITPAAMTSLN
jgi:hypothetical protein